MIVSGGGARFPNAAEPRAAEPTAAVHAERRQRPGHVRRARRAAHDRLVGRQGGVPVLPAGLGPHLPGGKLHLRALAQHQQALPGRAAPRSSCSAASPTSHSPVTRACCSTPRPRSASVSPASTHRCATSPTSHPRARAVQHPRHRAGALHVLESRRSTTATTVAVVVVPPVVSLAMDAGRTRSGLGGDVCVGLRRCRVPAVG